MPVYTTKLIKTCTVADVLTSNYGNQSKTARDLNINRGSLRGWIESCEYKHMIVEVIDNDDSQSFKLINHSYGGK